MKRPRSGLFAGVRSLPLWLRAVWPGGLRAGREEAVDESTSAGDGPSAFDASLIPVPRWPRLRVGASSALACRGCSICVDVCPSHALDANAPDALALDLGRCIGCGLCVERCPEAKLELVEGMPVLFAPLAPPPLHAPWAVEGLRVLLGERGAR